MRQLILLAIIMYCALSSARESSISAVEQACRTELKAIPGAFNYDEIDAVCKGAKQLESCTSDQGRPIFHFEKTGSTSKGKKILAMSLIHGDERPSGSVTRAWLSRLGKIDPRNSWRVIPVANPDGFHTDTRMNAKGVDLNRNFPTKEWEAAALKSWKTTTKSDPRRYPGASAASETETKCLLKHFEDFKPDFIISIHTPIGVLDFDGPPVRVPKNSPLPWTPLGNFPGSLGRYMWKDNNIPVLTIELKGNAGVAKLEQLDQLQDISGSLAIQAKGTKSEAKN